MQKKRSNKSIPELKLPEENNLNQALEKIRDDLLQSDHTGKLTNKLKSPLLFKGQCWYIFNFQTGKIESPVGVKELLGYEDDELSTELMVNYFHPDDAPIVNIILKSVWEIAISGHNPEWTSFQITFRGRHKNGNYIKLLRQSRILTTDNHGRMISNLSQLTDISFMDNSSKIHWELRTKDNKKLNHIEKAIKSGIRKQFTPREEQILKLLSAGLISREIARKLGTSTHTVNTQRRKLLEKTGCRNAVSLIEYARQVL